MSRKIVLFAVVLLAALAVHAATAETIVLSSGNPSITVNAPPGTSVRKIITGKTIWYFDTNHQPITVNVVKYVVRRTFWYTPFVKKISRVYTVAYGKSLEISGITIANSVREYCTENIMTVSKTVRFPTNYNIGWDTLRCRLSVNYILHYPISGRVYKSGSTVFVSSADSNALQPYLTVQIKIDNIHRIDPQFVLYYRAIPLKIPCTIDINGKTYKVTLKLNGKIDEYDYTPQELKKLKYSAAIKVPIPYSNEPITIGKSVQLHGWVPRLVTAKFTPLTVAAGHTIFMAPANTKKIFGDYIYSPKLIIRTNKGYALVSGYLSIAQPNILDAIKPHKVFPIHASATCYLFTSGNSATLTINAKAYPVVLDSSKINTLETVHLTVGTHRIVLNIPHKVHSVIYVHVVRPEVVSVSAPKRVWFFPRAIAHDIHGRVVDISYVYRPLSDQTIFATKKGGAFYLPVNYVANERAWYLCAPSFKIDTSVSIPGLIGVPGIQILPRISATTDEPLVCGGGFPKTRWYIAPYTYNSMPVYLPNYIMPKYIHHPYVSRFSNKLEIYVPVAHGNPSSWQITGTVLRWVYITIQVKSNNLNNLYSHYISSTGPITITISAQGVRQDLDWYTYNVKRTTYRPAKVWVTIGNREYVITNNKPLTITLTKSTCIKITRVSVKDEYITETYITGWYHGQYYNHWPTYTTKNISSTRNVDYTIRVEISKTPTLLVSIPQDVYGVHLCTCEYMPWCAEATVDTLRPSFPYLHTGENTIPISLYLGSTYLTTIYTKVVVVKPRLTMKTTVNYTENIPMLNITLHMDTIPGTWVTPEASCWGNTLRTTPVYGIKVYLDYMLIHTIPAADIVPTGNCILLKTYGKNNTFNCSVPLLPGTWNFMIQFLPRPNKASDNPPLIMKRFKVTVPLIYTPLKNLSTLQRPLCSCGAPIAMSLWGVKAVYFKIGNATYYVNIPRAGTYIIDLPVHDNRTPIKVYLEPAQSPHCKPFEADYIHARVLHAMQYDGKIPCNAIPYLCKNYTIINGSEFMPGTRIPLIINVFKGHTILTTVNIVYANMTYFPSGNLTDLNDINKTRVDVPFQVTAINTSRVTALACNKEGCDVKNMQLDVAYPPQATIHPIKEVKPGIYIEITKMDPSVYFDWYDDVWTESLLCQFKAWVTGIDALAKITVTSPTKRVYYPYPKKVYRGGFIYSVDYTPSGSAFTDHIYVSITAKDAYGQTAKATGTCSITIPGNNPLAPPKVRKKINNPTPPSNKTAKTPVPAPTPTPTPKKKSGRKIEVKITNKASFVNPVPVTKSATVDFQVLAQNTYIKSIVAYVNGKQLKSFSVPSDSTSYTGSVTLNLKNYKPGSSLNVSVVATSTKNDKASDYVIVKPSSVSVKITSVQTNGNTVTMSISAKAYGTSLTSLDVYRDGNLVKDESISGTSYTTTVTLTLSTGTHTLSVKVTGKDGSTATDSRTVTIKPAISTEHTVTVYAVCNDKNLPVTEWLMFEYNGKWYILGYYDITGDTMYLGPIHSGWTPTLSNEQTAEGIPYSQVAGQYKFSKLGSGTFTVYTGFIRNNKPLKYYSEKDVSIQVISNGLLSPK